MDAEFSSFRRRLSRELLPLSKRDGILEKKALACSWQIGVSPCRRLEGCGMSRRVDGFPAGKHDERICTRLAWGRARGDNTRSETEDDSTKRVLHLPIFLLSSPRKEKRNIPSRVARLIPLILASGARSKKKNKSALGTCSRRWRSQLRSFLEKKKLTLISFIYIYIFPNVLHQ